MSSEVIKRENGEFMFNEIPLYYGRKLIDIENAKKNLLDFKLLMHDKGVSFGLIYGTLLGAVREKGFIEYDEDVDVFILDEYRADTLNLLEEFDAIGFKVARYQGDLLSLIREDDYIDVYFFKKSFLSRKCNGDSLPNKFFNGYDTIDLYGQKYKAPKNVNEFLVYAYGVDWNVPKRNSPAVVLSIGTRVKNQVKKVLPVFVIEFLKRFKG